MALSICRMPWRAEGKHRGYYISSDRDKKFMISQVVPHGEWSVAKYRADGKLTDEQTRHADLADALDQVLEEYELALAAEVLAAFSR